MNKLIVVLVSIVILVSCKDKLTPLAKNALQPKIITVKTTHDTDDPAIWIHPTNTSNSLIIGTDKDSNGALYLYDLNGKIIKKSIPLKRPNNVDVAYNLKVGDVTLDIAVTTERETNKIRIFSLPNLEPIDNGGIEVFEGETERNPMGIALYTRPADGEIFAIVGRKNGPSGSYLWQYQLKSKNGVVQAKIIRKFGNYSGKKEIEAIAVDNELGFVYYSDEQIGIRKYLADPSKNDNNEIAIFGQNDFKSDNEGIAIYKKSETTGYILVSNQQENTFIAYTREENSNKKNKHPKIAEIPTSTIECDGADATSIPLSKAFSAGMLVAMSNGKTFHYYDWNLIQNEINKQK